MDKRLLGWADLYIKLLGLHPKAFSVIWGCFHIACLTITLTLTLLEMIINWNGAETLGNGTEMVVAICQLIIKGLTLLLFPKKFEELTDIIARKFWPINKFGDVLQKEIQEIHSFLNQIFSKYQIVLGFTSVMYYLKPLILRERIYPTNCYSWQVLNIFQLYAILIGFDGLFFALLSYAYCELKMIKFGFTNLKFQETKIGVKQFSELVEHHSLVLGFIAKLSDTYSLLLLVQFFASLFNICLAIYLLLSKGFPPSLFLMSRYVPILLSWNVQVYVYCLAGERISEQSESVSDVIYESNWCINNKLKLGRAIQLVMQRARHRPDITAGNLWKLNMRTFVMILQKSVSFFTFIQTLCDVEETETN